MVTLPVLIGIGAAWKAKSDVAGLYASHQALEARKRQLPRGHRSAVRPDRVAAVGDRGPRRAVGARPEPGAGDGQAAGAGEGARHGRRRRPRRRVGATGSPTPRRCRRSPNPEDTFGLLRTLLEGLESRLHVGPHATSRSATRWPPPRRRSGRRTAGCRRAMGPRTDPVTGGGDYPRRPRHRRRQGPAGLRDRRRHGRRRPATRAPTAT